jgi:hypothetical protein
MSALASNDNVEFIFLFATDTNTNVATDEALKCLVNMLANLPSTVPQLANLGLPKYLMNKLQVYAKEKKRRERKRKHHTTIFARQLSFKTRWR